MELLIFGGLNNKSCVVILEKKIEFKKRGKWGKRQHLI